jgi:hypothetical protein
MSNTANTSRRFQIRDDNKAGINGVFDSEANKFVGHTQTVSGCQSLRRNIERRANNAS